MPRNNRKKEEVEIEILPDSPEAVAETVTRTGYRAKIATVFQEAIKKAKEKMR